MIHSVNLQAALESVTEYWSPKVVEPVNDQYVKVAKLKGSPAWYMHDQEDELFQVIYGSLRIEFKNDAEVILNSGRILRSSEERPSQSSCRGRIRNAHTSELHSLCCSGLALEHQLD
jgi:hypothetical protein